MKKRILTMETLITSLVLISSQNAQAHCEVPCGIYDDAARLEQIEEHCTTITKAMAQITAISSETEINHNQLVRWINEKEAHANKIQKIVSQYFMTQRIKVLSEKDPKYKKNLENLQELHKILVAAMKCKQTTDVSQVIKIIKAVHNLEKVYPTKIHHKH